MTNRKWKEIKQQPSMLPGPAVPGSCLVSFYFWWAIHPIRPALSCPAKEIFCPAWPVAASCSCCCPDPPPQPECTRDPDCPEDLACISEHCLNPCSAKTCGKNAACGAKRHTAVCTCLPGFIGDPASVCRERKPESMISLEGGVGGVHSLADYLSKKLRCDQFVYLLKEL